MHFPDIDIHTPALLNGCALALAAELALLVFCGSTISFWHGMVNNE